MVRKDLKNRFFLIASPGRTGSSLFTHLLRGHKRVSIVSEPYIHDFEKILEEDELEALFDLLRYSWTELVSDNVIGMAEKTGSQFNSIMKYFAEKIILITRDPRDALASAQEKWFKGDKKNARFHNSLEYLNTSRELHKWFLETSENVPGLYIRYEDLVLNPVITIRKVCKFLEVDSSFGVVSNFIFKAQESNFKSRGDKKIKKNGTKLKDVSIERWRKDLSSEDVELVKSVFKGTIDHFGYKI